MTEMNKYSNPLVSNPLVSILLPVFNAERYLHASLTSTLTQNYTNIEVICVDDGSTDSSLKILKTFAKSDKRVKVYANKKNSGIGYTANKALSHAKGEFIARMDADDIMLPGRIAKQVEFLQTNPDTVLVGGQCKVINENGEQIGEKRNPVAHNDIYKLMFTAMAVQNPTIMINRKLVPQKALKLDTKLHPVDDLDMLFKLFKFGKFANLADFVLQYRVYRGSSTMKNPKKSFLLTLKIRARAISEYGYRPTFQSMLTCLTQAVVVLTLPTSLLYTIYAHTRGIKKISLSLPTFRPLVYTVRNEVSS